MRGLILGQSPLNKEIEHFFAAKGWATHTLPDVLELRQLGGAVGDFTASLPGGPRPFDFVVVTQPTTPPPSFGGQPAQSLYAQNKPTLCHGLPPGEEVAFLLDAVCEAPLAATIRAMLDAEELAATQRRVHCFYRTVRKAGRGAEDLFQRARSNGVVFTRYDDIAIEPLGGSRFSVSAQGDGQHHHTTAGMVFADGDRTMNDAFLHCLKTLRLWPDTQGRLPEEKYFLAPVRSSRRGVFLIGKDLTPERLADGLRYLASSMAIWRHPADKSKNTAVIQGNHCAFCYTCYRACPHAALQPAPETRQMSCLPAACEGCGNCVSVCPAGAIQLETPPQKEADAKGPLLVLCCQNSAALALPKALNLLRRQPSTASLADDVHALTLPCGGNLGLEDITAALLHYDKILVATCMEGACRHFEGNHRARLQCQRLGELLAALGLPQSRLRFLLCSHALPGALKDELQDFLLAPHHAQEAPK